MDPQVSLFTVISNATAQNAKEQAADRKEQADQSRHSHDKNLRTKHRELTRAETTSRTKSMQQTQAQNQYEKMTRDEAVQTLSKDLKFLLKDVKSMAPKLQSPSADLRARTQQEVKQDISLIALVSKIMILVIQANSDSWKALFQMATQSMDMSLQMSKVSAEQTKQNFNSQAKATKNQAEMAKITGITSLVTFGATLGVGAMLPVEAEATEDTNKTVLEDTTKGAEEGAGKAATETLEESTAPAEGAGAEAPVAEEAGTGMARGSEAELEEAASPPPEEAAAAPEETGDPTDSVVRDAVSSGADEAPSGTATERMASAVKDAGEKTQSSLMKRVMNVIQVSGMMNMLSSGANGLTQAKYESRVAKNQREAGMHDAASKIAQGYSEYASQSYSRSQSVADSINQNIGMAKDAIISTAQGITSSVHSMYG